MTETNQCAKTYNIAGYCRISVDEELDRDNVSIVNQKAIITDFVNTHFKDSELTFYEDRDKSGYTFAQRTGYQEMRKLLINNVYDILIVKDFSRFSRRNSKGLSELEDLRDYGLRIIAITDNVDYPTNDDWMNIQFRFLMNEMPVTDTSKKVRKIIENRQKNGQWICNAPYGYYLNPLKKNEILIDKTGAETVHLIFKLYNNGYGYKKIAKYLTENHYPTGFTLMARQLNARDADASKVLNRASNIWSPVSVSKIIQNDFYVGTLRQHVWTRKGINKADIRVPLKEQLVHYNHHPAIIEQEVFNNAQQNYTKRSKTHYKGVRKYQNTYSGFLFCADCNSPMFSISNPNRPAGYICSSYHKHGLNGCTSHHIHEESIAKNIKLYISIIRNNLQDAILYIDVKKSKAQADEATYAIKNIQQKIEQIKLELKESSKQRLKQLVKNPDNEEIINENFDELEQDYLSEINGLEGRCRYLSTEAQKKSEMKKNINSVLNVFDALLAKDNFSKQDIALIIERINVDNDKIITIELKSDIAELFSFIGESE